MYLASKASSPAQPEIAEVLGSSGVKSRWLINRECGGPTTGKIGLIETEPAGAVKLTAAKGGERTVFILGGRGMAQGEELAANLRAGTVLFLPDGRGLEMRAQDGPLRLLLIHNDLSESRGTEMGRGARTSAIPQIVQLEEVENVPFHRPELGFLHVSARWLVGLKGGKSRALVVGQSTFVAGAAHLLHRHSHADEFFYVLEGQGIHLVADREVPMQEGNVVFTPRLEWHGFRNTADRPVRAIFGFFGVNSLENAGYEVHESGIRIADS